MGSGHLSFLIGPGDRRQIPGKSIGRLLHQGRMHRHTHGEGNRLLTSLGLRQFNGPFCMIA